MDHSSSLPLIAKLAKNAKIISSERGKEALIKHYGADFNVLKPSRQATKSNWKENFAVFGGANAALARQHVHLYCGRQNLDA